MEIRKRLFFVSSILIAAALACSLQSQENTNEVDEAFELYITCVSDRRLISDGDPHKECASFASDEQLELISLHTKCQDDLCDEAVSIEIDARVGDILCVELTPEECANAGQHFYDEQLTSAEPAECDTFEWPDNFALQSISFENDKVVLERWSGAEGYNGHVRVAPNTYQWIDSALVRTIVFSADGYQQVDYQELNNCTWTYTFRLSD